MHNNTGKISGANLLLAEVCARPHSARGFVEFDWDRRQTSWQKPPARPSSAGPRLPSQKECQAKRRAAPPQAPAPARPAAPKKGKKELTQGGAATCGTAEQMPAPTPAPAGPTATPWATLCAALAEGRPGLAALQRLGPAGSLGPLPTEVAGAWTQMWAHMELTSGKASEVRKRALPTVFAVLMDFLRQPHSTQGQLQRLRQVLEALAPSGRPLAARLLDGVPTKVAGQLPWTVVQWALATWPAQARPTDPEAVDLCHAAWLQRAAGQRAVAVELVEKAETTLVRLSANPRLLGAMAKLLANVAQPPPALLAAFLAQAARTPMALGLMAPGLFSPAHPAFAPLHGVATRAATVAGKDLDAQAVAGLVLTAQQALRGKKATEDGKREVGANLVEVLKAWPASLLQGSWSNPADLAWIRRAASQSQDVAAVYTCSLEMRLLAADPATEALLAEEVAVVRSFARPAHQLRLVAAIQAHGPRDGASATQAAELLLCANATLRVGDFTPDAALAETVLELADACAQKGPACFVAAGLRQALADSCYFVAELAAMGHDDAASAMARHLGTPEAQAQNVLGRLVQRFGQFSSLRPCEKMAGILQLNAAYRSGAPGPKPPWLQQQARLLVFLLTLQTQRRVDGLAALARGPQDLLHKDELLGATKVLLRRNLFAPVQGGETFVRRLHALLVQRPDWHELLVAESFRWLASIEHRHGPTDPMERLGLVPLFALLCASAAADRRQALAIDCAARLGVQRLGHLPDMALPRQAHRHAHGVHAALYASLVVAREPGGGAAGPVDVAEVAERQETYLQGILYAQAAHDDVGVCAQAVGRAALHPAAEREGLYAALVGALAEAMEGALENKLLQNFVDHFVNGVTLLWVAEQQNDAPRRLVGQFFAEVGELLSFWQGPLAEGLLAELVRMVEHEAKVLQEASLAPEAMALRLGMAELVRRANVRPRRAELPLVKPETLDLLQHWARASDGRAERILTDLPREGGALETRVTAWLAAEVPLAANQVPKPGPSASNALDALLVDPEVDRCLRGALAHEVGATTLAATLRQRLFQASGRGMAAADAL